MSNWRKVLSFEEHDVLNTWVPNNQNAELGNWMYSDTEFPELDTFPTPDGGVVSQIIEENLSTYQDGLAEFVGDGQSMYTEEGGGDTAHATVFSTLGQKYLFTFPNLAFGEAPATVFAKEI